MLHSRGGAAFTASALEDEDGGAASDLVGGWLLEKEDG